MEENDNASELERLRPYGMNLVARRVNHQPYNGHSLDELKVLEGLCSNSYIYQLFSSSAVSLLYSPSLQFTLSKLFPLYITIACAEQPEFTSSVHSKCVLNVLNNASDTTEEMVGAIKTKHSDQARY